MKTGILVDTDILIDLARQVPKAVGYLKAKENTHTLEISVVTEMELLVGCRNKKELRALGDLLDRFKIVQMQPEVSEMAAKLVRTYRLSHGLLIPDALIAATAFIAEVPLATRNKKDYRFITGLKLAQYPK